VARVRTSFTAIHRQSNPETQFVTTDTPSVDAISITIPGICVGEMTGRQARWERIPTTIGSGFRQSSVSNPLTDDEKSSLVPDSPGLPNRK